jgi:hypothetical protein
LVKFIKKIKPSALVHAEQSLASLREDPRNRENLICDVHVTENVSFSFIDIAIANPTTATSIHADSASSSLVAARRKEQEKIRKYRKYLKSDVMDKFIPFVIECTGALGPSARKFINDLCGVSAMCSEVASVMEERKGLLKSLSNVLMRANAQLMRHSRSSGSALSLC